MLKKIPKLIKKKTAAEQLPWQRFRVGTPSTRRNWVEPDCQPFTEVSHVAHLEAAHRIVTDGRIRAGLISDESKLNQERIQVAWLSPNHWMQGFRYGSVRFAFDWPQLIQGHRFYWVESIAYGVRACRILVTQNDYSGHHVLIPYDPTVGDGPWWFDEESDTHYRNGNYCLEFMIDHDLRLTDLEDLGFEKHHRHQCCINRSTCPERGMEAAQAAARFLARLAATGTNLPDSIREDEDNGCAQRLIRDALRHIEREVMERAEEEFTGTLTPGDPSSFPVARELLNTYARPALRDDIPYLARLFRSQEDLMDCCSCLIEEVIRPERSS